MGQFCEHLLFYMFFKVFRFSKQKKKHLAVKQGLQGVSTHVTFTQHRQIVHCSSCIRKMTKKFLRFPQPRKTSENLRKPQKTTETSRVGNLCQFSRKPPEKDFYGNLWKPTEIYGNLRKSTEISNY